MGQGQTHSSDVSLIQKLSQQLLKHCKDGCSAEVGVFKSFLDQGADPNTHDVYGLHPLWYASRYGKRDLVELFLQYKADVNLTTKGYRKDTALHAASKYGHMDVATQLLQHGAVVNSQNKDCQTALHHASWNGFNFVVKLLVDSGAQLGNKDKGGQTALHHASKSGHDVVVKLLVDSGAQLDIEDNGGQTALHYASKSGHDVVFKLLVDSGARLDNKDKDGQTALHHASRSGHNVVVKLLVDSGAQLDIEDNDGQTALHHASRNGHTGVVKLLVDSGARLDIKDKDSQTALYFASYNHHTDVVNVLLASGAQHDIKYLGVQLLKLCKDGCTAEVEVFKSLLNQGVDPNIAMDGCHPLWYASHYGKRDLVELFLQYKAESDVNLTNKHVKEAALHTACRNGHVNVATLLLQRGVAVDGQDKGGQTALHHASKRGRNVVVMLLVDSGAQLDNKDKDGQTALHHASRNGHTDVVKLLLDSGARLDVKDKDGQTALYLASNNHHTYVVNVLLASGAQPDIKYLGVQLLKLCTAGCTAEVEVFKSLLDQGADPNIATHENNHPLWYASHYGKSELVELFLQYKADVNLTSKPVKETALHTACRNGHVNVATLLLQRGVAVDGQDKDGQTALHCASSIGQSHTGVVKLLVDSGAQLDNKDKNGHTALHHASRRGHTGVVKLLVDSGARLDVKDKDGQTALHHASKSGHSDVVKVLVDSGAQLNNEDNYGKTALDLTSSYNQTDVGEVLLASGAQHGKIHVGDQLLKICEDGCTAEVGVFKSLLDQGASPNIAKKGGDYPLWYASRYGKKDLVELFLQYKGDINLKTESYRKETALHAACKYGHMDVASLLIQHGAAVVSQDKDGQTALHHASSNGHTDVVKLLVDSGAQLDNKDNHGRTALNHASGSGHTGVIKLLVDSGAQLDNKDKGQQLLKLCKDDCTAEVGVFKSLLDQGVDPNIQDEHGGNHPLWYASRYGKRDLVELFLQYKADINLKTKGSFGSGKTALHAACEHRNINVAILLIQHGAVMDIQDKYGQTALHCASRSGHTDVVKLLVDSGAQIENKDRFVRTALHHASRSGHIDVVKLLADSGAQLDSKDRDEQTSLDYAKKKGHSEIVNLLEKVAQNTSSITEEPSSIGDNETEEDKPSDDVGPTVSDSDDTSSENLAKQDEARAKSPAPSGHILLKHELVALAKLLAAYSDEKLKEIKVNLEKKQGGDISREEVERSLRESGLTSIANDLKENLGKSIEDQQHYEAYESALKGGLALTMQYLKFLFFGPPRTGKSTARRRLVQEIVNLDSLGEPSVSTGVAEANDVIIKKLTSEPAAISGSRWWSMKRSKEDGQIDKGDCDYLAQLFYRLISKAMNETEQSITVPATVSEPATSINERETEESVTPDPTVIKEASSPLKSPNLQDHPQINRMAEFQAELSSVPLSKSEEKQIDEAFKKLTSTLQSGSPDELRKLLEDLAMLNMVDVGGQSAFLELCPAFTTGPALYLIFFRLDQELKKNYQIKFQSACGEETILESSYCTETVIHQTLSSIACFERRSTAECAESASLSTVSGRAILFGTYKDKVDDERISQMNTALRQQLEHTKLYKEDLLLQASEDTLFYSLNNMTGDDSEMSPIRKDIEKIIKNMFSKVDIPASWLMFRIILHFLHKPVVSFTECEEIARRLSMTTPVREAIWFFHHNIGSLMHYPDIPSMKNVVICDSQVVFDSTSELIIDTFKVSNRDIPQSAVKDFREKGQFSLEHIKDRTESHRQEQLSLMQLVDLLKSHNILAEIKSDQESSEQLKPSQESSASNRNQPKFVMPAVLRDASEDELELKDSKQEAAPLMIQFESGFVPFGVFCASIANLIAHQDTLSPRWQLCDEQVMKNKVKFSIDISFYTTLISRPQYLEIRVERHPRGRSKRSLANICSTVRQTVVQTLETVISKMKYNSHAFPTDQSFKLAFTCLLEESHRDHLMKVDKDESGYFGKCPKDPIGLDLEKKHLVWFDLDNCSRNVAQLDAFPSISNVSDMLSSGELHTVLNLTWDARSKWYNIGLGLGISVGTLDAVKINHREDCDECYTEVLKRWLRNDPSPTWRALADALRAPSVKMSHIAEQLLAKSR